MGFLNPKLVYNVKATDFDPNITWKRVPCVSKPPVLDSFDHHLAPPCPTISSSLLKSSLLLQMLTHSQGIFNRPKDAT